jgi:hypothetical protein
MKRKKVGLHGYSSRRIPDKPARKQIKLVWDDPEREICKHEIAALAALAQAEATLAAGKRGAESAQSHFIAIVKALEEAMGFHFEEIEE